VDFGKKFGEHGRILLVNGKNTKATKMLGRADFRPSNLALAARTGFFASPEEGSSPLINGFDDPRREDSGGHSMGEHSSEDRVDKKEAPSNRKRTPAPPREAQVTFSNDRVEVSKAKFMSGEGKTEVCLGKGGDRTAESKCHGGSRFCRRIDRNKGVFVEVDSQASVRGESVKGSFKVGNMLGDGPDDDEGIISILENRTRKVVDQGVKQKPLTRGLEKKLLEDISNDVEKEGGEGVALTQTTPTLDPPPGDAIKKDRSLARMVQQGNPVAPQGRESFGQKDAIKRVPADGIKSFSEVQHENSSRSGAAVASLDNIGSIDKIFGNRASRDKPGLVWVN
jgi:hypothetical protein